MHDYREIQKEYSIAVSRTVDEPIMILDTWELSDAFLSLGNMLFFGIVIDSIFLLFLSLCISLVLVPLVKKKCRKGVFLHTPYKYLGMTLPGLAQPGTGKNYSD